MKTLPVAVQVYSVRDDAERDFKGTMQKIIEGQSNEQRKDRNKDPGYQGKNNILKFLQQGSHQLCFGPCRSQTQHNSQNQSTHDRHDLWNRKLKNHIRKTSQAVCTGADR